MHGARLKAPFDSFKLMIFLDIRTSYFFAFVSHGLLAIVVASFWRSGRSERGFAWWIFDGVQLSLASLLLLCIGTLPPWLILTSSNLLIFANLPTIETALRAFFREPAWPGLSARWAVAMLIFAAWVMAMEGGWTYAQRVIGFSAAFLIQLGLLLAYVVNLRGSGNRLAKGLLLTAIFLVGTAVVVRMGYVLRHMDAMRSATDDWLLPLLTFAAIFAAFLRTCCALLLMHSRVEQHLRAAHRDIERRANYDQQTGVMSRAYFEVQAQGMLDKATPGQKPTALLLLDVDHFKSVNDTFGHLVGDDLLGKLGQVLRQNARSHDLVGRLGGDEFVMLLRDVSGAAAIEFAERIIVQTSGILMPDGRSVSLSVGICSAVPGQAFAMIYRLADAALYSAKQAGRGRVAAHDPFHLSRAGAPQRADASATLDL